MQLTSCAYLTFSFTVSLNRKISHLLI